MFNIFDLETKALVLDSEGEPLSFESGKEASDYCKAQGGKRLQPRRTGTDKNWKTREHNRIIDGSYIRPQYLAAIEINKDHYLHLSVLSDKRLDGAIAYTKNEQNGMADVQTRSTLQGYYERYKGDFVRLFWDKVEAEWQINRAIKQHTNFLRAADGLKFATTPEEIAKVYTNYNQNCEQVSASCMRYLFPGCYVHPASVYGAGDLAVAYLTDDEGRTTARALCWPEKKIYSRVYCDDSSLHDLLKQRGFKKSEYYDDNDDEDIDEDEYENRKMDNTRSFAGAKLLKAGHKNRNAYIVPYVDEDLGIVIGDDFLKLVRGRADIDSGLTCGWSDGTNGQAPPEQCHYCHEELGVRRARVFTTDNGQNWVWACYSCAETHSFVCSESGNRYDNETCKKVVMHNGAIWSKYVFDRHGSTCECCNKNFPARSVVEVEKADGFFSRVCRECVAEKLKSKDIISMPYMTYPSEIHYAWKDVPLVPFYAEDGRTKKFTTKQDFQNNHFVDAYDGKAYANNANYTMLDDGTVVLERNVSKYIYRTYGVSKDAYYLIRNNLGGSILASAKNDLKNRSKLDSKLANLLKERIEELILSEMKTLRRRHRVSDEYLATHYCGSYRIKPSRSAKSIKIDVQELIKKSSDDEAKTTRGFAAITTSTTSTAPIPVTFTVTNR